MALSISSPARTPTNKMGLPNGNIVISSILLVHFLSLPLLQLPSGLKQSSPRYTSSTSLLPRSSPGLPRTNACTRVHPSTHPSVRLGVPALYFFRPLNAPNSLLAQLVAFTFVSVPIIKVIGVTTRSPVASASLATSPSSNMRCSSPLIGSPSHTERRLYILNGNMPCQLNFRLSSGLIPGTSSPALLTSFLSVANGSSKSRLARTDPLSATKPASLPVVSRRSMGSTTMRHLHRWLG
ncbi:hypothetical protein KSP39_PZI018790 [Platanthera zijinensis]|uniref:Uncharacterized protein n=1 Tax=Platanthera zijinensis TaxID=2320716 RepID=A0AAP0B2X5_9ASPA